MSKIQRPVVAVALYSAQTLQLVGVLRESLVVSEPLCAGGLLESHLEMDRHAAQDEANRKSSEGARVLHWRPVVLETVPAELTNLELDLTENLHKLPFLLFLSLRLPDLKCAYYCLLCEPWEKTKADLTSQILEHQAQNRPLPRVFEQLLLNLKAS